mmetsp:Transcript_10928/g.47292  ORF Transcript_10928/g.47292 Transcript_10928/m.47292 type:complete len:219 (-) Transcript_10928:1697-2353(-)
MYRSQSTRSIRPRSLRKKRRTSSYMDRARDALTAADASAMGSMSAWGPSRAPAPSRTFPAATSASSSSPRKSSGSTTRRSRASCGSRRKPPRVEVAASDAASDAASINAPCSSKSVNAWSLESSTSNPTFSSAGADSAAASSASTLSLSRSREMNPEASASSVFPTVLSTVFSRSAAKVFAANSPSRGDRPGSESGSSDAAASHRSGLALLWSGPLPS